MTSRPKTVPKSPCRSLPMILNSRYLSPFRPSLKKDILNSLVNGYYTMNSNGEITDLQDQITAVALDPAECKLLLYSTANGRLRVCRVQEIDYCKDFIIEDVCIFAFGHQIRHAQWYPGDPGLFCCVEPKSINLVDANTFDVVSQLYFSEDTLVHCDWNSRETTAIAIGCQSPRVKLFDIRNETAVSGFTITGPSTADRQHNLHRQVTRVMWSPLDSTGLFVSDTIGDMFFYDTRNLKSPLGQKRADDHSLFLPVVYLGMTPDDRNLITAHGSTSHITQWNFQPKSGEFLSNSNINYQPSSAVRPASRPSGGHGRVTPKQAVNITLFPTMDRIYAPNMSRIGPDLLAFNRHTGAPEPQHELLHPAAKRPVCHVIGFRRTKYGDDPNPALIYTTNSQIIISRMLTHSEPFDMVAENEEKGRVQKRPRHHLHEDRWSDSD